jgi:hypothetical protein
MEEAWDKHEDGKSNRDHRPDSLPRVVGATAGDENLDVANAPGLRGSVFQ